MRNDAIAKTAGQGFAKRHGGFLDIERNGSVPKAHARLLRSVD